MSILAGRQSIRRVVTGLDAEGRSAVLFDDQVPLSGTKILWTTDAIPADNSGSADAGDKPFTFDIFKSAGSTFMLAVFQPGDTDGDLFMHATDTIDYLVLLSGRVELHLETGPVTIEPGTVIVDRGINHAWKMVGDEPVALLTVLLPAKPVGQGATV